MKFWGYKQTIDDNHMKEQSQMSNLRWKNVLLTSAGFFDSDEKPRANIINRFASMLNKPYAEAKVLFIPTAAGNEMPENFAFAAVQAFKILPVPAENQRALRKKNFRSAAA